MHKKYIDLINVAHITESVGCGHLEEIRFDATSTHRHRIDVTPISQQGPSSSKQVPFPPKHTPSSRNVNTADRNLRIYSSRK